MSAVLAATAAKFLRKTTLRDTEANTNFRMLDDDVAEAITSAAADEVTPLMSKVYTRLLLTPAEWRESERVLRFAGQEREGKWVTAWEQLRRHLRGITDDRDAHATTRQTDARPQMRFDDERRRRR